ncbi:hypothetical protein [Zavarzinia sp.]|uniref:hypothetical protein n=1 Tax=Zavarzinia sp. TaxID=2027920 RepID=UPI003568B006
MAKSSMGRFFSGTLFAEPSKAYAQMAIGIGVTAVLVIALGLAGAPLWAAGLVGGAVGGAVQPYLFKNLRYR